MFILAVRSGRKTPTIASMYRILWSLLPVSRLRLNYLKLLITNLVLDILQPPAVCCNFCYTFWDSMYSNFFFSPAGSKPEIHPLAQVLLNLVHTGLFFHFFFLSASLAVVCFYSKFSACGVFCIINQWLRCIF